MNQEEVAYTYNRILLSHKKEWNFAMWKNIREFEGYYAKWNKSGRERQILYDTTCMWNTKYKTN